MLFLYSVFFGAGVAAFAYTTIGRRAGYGNNQEVWTITGVVFGLASAFFYTILKVVIGL